MTAAADCVAWIERGLADARAGRSADALTSFGKAVACDPSAPGPHFHRGEILWQLGRRPDAIAAWREALLRDPDFIVPLAEALPLARQYAERASAAFPVPFPLLWPRRTGGGRLRIVVLPGPASDPVASRALDSIKALPADRFDLVIAVLGATSPAAVAAAAASYPGKRIVALTPALDGNDAKRLAQLDPDVLVDLAGLTAPTGPLLACRPARRIVTVAGIAFPHVPPLVDGAAIPALSPGDALARLRSDATVAVGVPDAAGMTSLWEGAVRAHQEGARPVARLGYERVLALQPGYAPAHYLLGMVLREGGDLRRARVEFDAAIAAAPRFVDARVAAARAARDAGDNAAAIALCTAGLRDAPHSGPLWSALGLARLAADDAAAAAGALERAAILAPKDADIRFKLGVAFHKQHIRDAAEKAYRQAIALRPAFADANFNLGVLCQERGSHDAAIAAYAAALDADRAHVAAYKNLGEVLFAAGRFDDWFANFRRFEANCPDALPMLVQGLEVCHYLPDIRKLDTCIERIAAGRFAVQDDAERVDCLEQILYLLLFFDVAPDVLLGLARTYDAVARRVYGESLRVDAVRRPGRLRIGYLSADLRNHVMGKMVWQAVQHHDRTRFELFFYSLSESEDEWTVRFRGLADCFTVLAAASERTAATTIAADDLDILVDLSTHTRGAKPGILAAKPARVQITYVASAGTVGLATVDFKLTDRFADLPEGAAFQIERPLPMDGCVYPYRHVAVAARHPFHRDALGIPAEAVVIGAFVTGLKLSRRCLELWREVLVRVPRAVLAFSPVAAAQRPLYTRLVKAAGIAEERIVFVPQGRDDSENLARYAVTDFVLDPMPYGGANGTLEALDMGVPVVTLVGRRHGERSSCSILTNLGVQHTIAYSPREYVELAVRLADDPAFMQQVRADIRAALERSPLTDGIGYTRALERAYLGALAAVQRRE